jgi:hypothetical protein
MMIQSSGVRRPFGWTGARAENFNGLNLLGSRCAARHSAARLHVVIQIQLPEAI